MTEGPGKLLEEAIEEKDRVARCIAVLNAADGGSWNRVVNLTETADTLVKAFCFPGVIVMAAHSSKWDIVNQLLPQVPDVKMRNFCCLTAAFYAAQETKWDLVNKYAENVTDNDSIRGLCLAVAAPFIAQENQLDFIEKLQQQSETRLNGSDLSCLVTVLHASRAAHWDIVQQFMEAVTNATFHDVCIMVAVFHAAKLEEWERLEEWMRSLRHQSLTDFCHLVVIQHATGVGQWIKAEKYISSTECSRMQQLVLSVTVSRAAKAGRTGAYLVRAYLETLFPRGITTEDLSERENFELNVANLHWIISEVEADSLVPWKCFPSKCSISSVLSKMFELICERNSKINEINETARTAEARASARPLTDIINYAKSSKWIQVQKLLVARNETQIKDVCCLAAAPYAAKNEQWNLVKKIVLFVESPTIKRLCCLAAVPHAAEAQQWELVLKLLDTLQDAEVKDLCCLAAVPHAAKAQQRELVRKLTDAVHDEEVKDQCRLAAVPNAEREQVALQAGEVETWESRMEDSTQLNPWLNNMRILAVTTEAIISSQWDVAVKLVPEAIGPVKEFCCCFAIINACNAGNWNAVELLLQNCSNQIRDFCILTAISFAAASPLTWGSLPRLLRSVSGVETLLICCQLVDESTNKTVMNIFDRSFCQLYCNLDYTRKVIITARQHEIYVIFALKSTSNVQLKDLMCGWVIWQAMKLSRLHQLPQLLQIVSNQRLRDIYCLDIFLDPQLLSHSDIWTQILKSVADDAIRDFCCFLAATNALHMSDWNLFMRALDFVTGAKVKSMCLLAAMAAASRTAQWDKVRWVLQKCSDTYMRDHCCRTSISLAARSSEWNLVLQVLNQVESASIRNWCLLAAMPHAARQRSWSVVRKLIHIAKEPVDHRMIGRQLSIFNRIGNQSVIDSLCESAAPFAIQPDLCRQLCEATTCQRVRDQCHLAAVQQTLQDSAHGDNWEPTDQLLQSVKDTRIKDLCCFHVASFAAKSAQWQPVAEKSIALATDNTIRDKCCKAAFYYAIASSEFELAKKMLDSISDVLIRDMCCEAAAPVAGKLDVSDESCNSAASQLVKDLRCLNTVSCVGPLKASRNQAESHRTAVNELLRSVVDARIRDLCYKHAAIQAAREKNWEAFASSLRDVVDSRNKDQCYLKSIGCALDQSSFELVVQMLNSVSDSLVRDGCCESVVPRAAVQGQWELVKVLLQSVTNTMIKDRCCASAAPHAAEQGQWELVDILLRTVTDTTIKDRCCEAAVPKAAAEEKWDIVKLCLELLENAIKKKDVCVSIASEFSESKKWTSANTFLRLVTNASIMNSCCHAIIDSLFNSLDLPTVGETLLTVLGNISEDETNMMCVTNAFVHTVQLGRADLTKRLLESGYLPNLESAESLELFANLTTRALLEFSRLVSQKAPQLVNDIVVRCTLQGHVSLAYAFLQHMANINWTDNSGTSVLMLSAEAGHIDLVAECLKMHASINLRDIEGRTALSRACSAGRQTVVSALIQATAELQHTDSNCLCAWLSVQRDFPARDGNFDGDIEASYKIPIDDNKVDEELSVEISNLLSSAGFTAERSRLQWKNADRLQDMARELTQDERDMTGSYADSWANSLMRVDGKTAADSDLDWTIILDRERLGYKHLEGGCQCPGEVEKLPLTDGHAVLELPAGNQPAVSIPACGVRPAQDICYAYQCCSSYREDRIRLLLPDPDTDTRVHLVRATRPGHPKDLRVSYSFQEKQIMRSLTTTQGQLYVLLKFAFKRLLPKTWNVQGLKTYHAKTLLFFMLEHQEPNVWQSKRLVWLLKKSLDLMLRFLKEQQSDDVCMEHFFMPGAPLHFKNVGDGTPCKQEKLKILQKLYNLRSNLTPLVALVRGHVKPLPSEKFHFQPFTLLPLKKINTRRLLRGTVSGATGVYLLVQRCLELLSEPEDNHNDLLQQLDRLRSLKNASSVATCLTAMAYMKVSNVNEARLQIESFSWQDEFYRFCFPCKRPTEFSLLPESAQSIIRLREYDNGKMLQVNFRCLLWNLQAELPPLSSWSMSRYARRKRWQTEAEADPDMEELYTLAQNSLCLERIRRCSSRMDGVSEERELDSIDKERIRNVRTRVSCFSLAYSVLAALLIMTMITICLQSLQVHGWSVRLTVHFASMMVLAVATVEHVQQMKFHLKSFWAGPPASSQRNHAETILSVFQIFFVSSALLISGFFVAKSILEDPCDYYRWTAKRKFVAATIGGHDFCICPWD